MIDFDQAMERVCGAARPLGREAVALADANGRVLADPVSAAVDAPPANVSAMDGYAVIESDLAVLPLSLPIVRENFAGCADPGRLSSGQCVRIFTGAPMPEGADRVVVQEVVRREGDMAMFDAPVAASRNVREQGGDFRCGEEVLGAGTRLGPRQLVAAAAADQPILSCWRRPRVEVLATGDELAAPGNAREQAGTIPESVSFGIAALIADWGGEIIARQRVGDRLEQMQACARQAAARADLIVVTGGASVGEKDFAKAMFAPLGLQLLFEKVAIKPGKPVWLGRVGDRMVMGLPGNPTSALVTARLLLAPLLAGMQGGDPAEAWHWQQRPLAAPLMANGERENFLRGALGPDGRVDPLVNQDSGAQRALARADVLIRRPANAAAEPVGALIDTLNF